MSADFIDSNILVYVFDKTDLRKSDIAAELVRRGQEDRTTIISFQVVQETLNALTRKLKVAPDDARLFMKIALVPLWGVMPSEGLYQSALEVQSVRGFSFYDSLIVAAALEADCARLYTEDLQHGQKIGRLTIHNPFRQ